MMIRCSKMLVLFLILLGSATSPACGHFTDSSELWGEFSAGEPYFRLFDQEGHTLLETGRRIYLHDQYLTDQNRLYEVIEVDDEKKIARAELVEEVELEVFSWEELKKELGLTAAQAAEEKARGKIAVYHTHNAESYVPTDGTDSIEGKGGIHRVGAAFTAALKTLGITVDYSEKLHLPHDRGAYRRSRETVLELLSHGPDAIFDVHRDAAPPSAYALQLGNEWVTRIQFVVGRQNQNLGINRKYAQSMKKIADELYPGLVKGIFFGRGNYNQDLTPLSLLLEVGAHTNSRPAAERGINLFADVVDLYFYGPQAEAASLSQKGAARSLAGLIFFLILTMSIFFVINAGGLHPAWQQLKKLLQGSRLK